MAELPRYGWSIVHNEPTTFHWPEPEAEMQASEMREEPQPEAAGAECECRCHNWHPGYCIECGPWHLTESIVQFLRPFEDRLTELHKALAQATARADRLAEERTTYREALRCFGHVACDHEPDVWCGTLDYDPISLWDLSRKVETPLATWTPQTKEAFRVFRQARAALAGDAGREGA